MTSLSRPKISFGVVLLTLTLVAGWWLVRRPTAEAGASVRVLCADDWLDGPTLDRFARARDVRVDLFTYADVGEFLRQLANADGHVDVICTSSLLLRSLVRGQWIRRAEFKTLTHARELSADFLNLPYDPDFAFGVPLHWTAFGYFSARAVEGSLKQIAARSRVGVWATPLNFLSLMTESGVSFEERLESEDSKRLRDDVQRFVAMTGAISPRDPNPAAWLKRYDVVHVPGALVTPGAGFFGPGEDGGIVDVGLLAIGERAARPDLGRELIDALIASGPSIEGAVRTGRGAVVGASEGDARLKPAQRPSALRAMPLTKMRFPDVNAEATLKFSKMLGSATGG